MLPIDFVVARRTRERHGAVAVDCVAMVGSAPAAGITLHTYSMTFAVLEAITGALAHARHRATVCHANVMGLRRDL
jgi:hypothetical protein